MHIFLVLQLIALALQIGCLVAAILLYRSDDYDRALTFAGVSQVLVVPNLLFAALYFATR